MDWAAFKARRERAPATARVPLCADGDAVRELEEAQQSRDVAAVEKARAKVAEATWWVDCVALSADDYRDLKESHRAKGEAAAKGAEWDEATFVPALIAASTGLDADEVAELLGIVTAAERARLFLACRDLNETVPDLDFIVPGTATTAGTGRPSTTAPRKASRSTSSKRGRSAAKKPRSPGS